MIVELFLVGHARASTRTADAARVAATKGVGWRRKPEPERRPLRRTPGQQQRSPAVASVTAPATSSECPARSGGRRFVPSAARSSQAALSLGREQPPGLHRVSTPAPARRVAHAPMSMPECSRVLAAIWPPNARVLSRANAPQIPRGTRCTSRRSFSPEVGPHQFRIELCSASSRLSPRSTLRVAALTTPPRSSKAALM